MAKKEIHEAVLNHLILCEKCYAAAKKMIKTEEAKHVRLKESIRKKPYIKGTK